MLIMMALNLVLMESTDNRIVVRVVFELWRMSANSLCVLPSAIEPAPPKTKPHQSRELPHRLIPV